MKIRSKPAICTNIHDLLAEQGLSASRFADSVSSFGGGRTAAFKLARGETNVSATTMLVAAHVLELPVETLFWLAYEPPTS